ncbi:MAG: hypothetical protein ABR886_09640 [Dehalococcoidales bacterium]|jgi:hypothetical protein
MTTLTLVIVAALVIGITVFKLPLRLGLVKPAAVRMISQTPDREAALKVKSDIQQAGINTSGVDVFVMPEKKSNKNVLLTVLDTSKGFSFGNAGSTDAISNYLIKLASASASDNIDRVAFQYLDSEGKSLATITAPTDAILKYSKGQISQTEFFKAIDARIDLSQLATSGLP